MTNNEIPPSRNSNAGVRILIQTVGTGGPNNPVWESLAVAFKEMNAAVLVQLCSEKTKQATLPRFQELVDLASVDRRVHVSADVDDVEALTLEYGQIVDELIAEFPEARLSLDFTSGTKPMSGAAVAVAVSRRVPNILYGPGPRDQTGRATKTTHLQNVGTGTLVAERTLDELGRLFDCGQFAAVASQARPLKKTVEDPLLLARAQSLRYLAEVYELWDRFDWKQAAAKLRDRKNFERKTEAISRAGWLMHELEQQHRHLSKCRQNLPSPDRQADLLANISRRIASSQADDAFARLYRLTELILQERFANQIRRNSGSPNPTSNVPVSTLKETVPKALEDILKRKSPSQSEKLSLGLTDAMLCLSTVGDPLGRQMWNDYTGGTGVFNQRRMGPLYNLLEKRNNSWLAHGSEVAEIDDAVDLKSKVESYLRFHVENPPDPAAPTADADDLLACARFSKCPWV